MPSLRFAFQGRVPSRKACIPAAITTAYAQGRSLPDTALCQWCFFLGTFPFRTFTKNTVVPGGCPGGTAWKEVKVHTMRKISALALMALALALFAMGCGKKAEETPAATETTMEAADSMGMAMDSTSTMSADSTMAH